MRCLSVRGSGHCRAGRGNCERVAPLAHYRSTATRIEIASRAIVVAPRPKNLVARASLRPSPWDAQSPALLRNRCIWRKRLSGGGRCARDNTRYGRIRDASRLETTRDKLEHLVRGDGSRRAPCTFATPERRRACPGAASSASPRRRRRRRAVSRPSRLQRPPLTTARHRLRQSTRHSHSLRRRR